MARPGGISGDEIRREQEESRRRSRFGGPSSRPLRPSVSLYVTWIEIDWLMPLAACAALGFGQLGLGLVAVAIGLSVFSSTVVTVRRGDDGVEATVRKAWRSADRAQLIAVDAAIFHFRNAWLCRGLELVGTNASIAASGRRGAWLRPPLGVPAVSVRPRIRPTALSIALNVPNIMVNVAAIAAVWNVSRYSPVISLFAVLSVFSSLTNGLFGGPELRITPVRGGHT